MYFQKKAYHSFSVFYCPYLFYFGGGDIAVMYSLCTQWIHTDEPREASPTKKKSWQNRNSINKEFLVPKLEREYRQLNSVRAHNHITWFELESLIHHQRVMVHIITCTILKCLPRQETLTLGRVKKVRKSTVSGGFSSRSYRKPVIIRKKQKENALGFR